MIAQEHRINTAGNNLKRDLSAVLDDKDNENNNIKEKKVKLYKQIDDDTCDFEIVTEYGEVIRVHKEILFKNKVLKTALSCGLSETIENRWMLENDEYFGFINFIKFMYDQQSSLERAFLICVNKNSSSSSTDSKTLSLADAFLALDVAKKYEDALFENYCKTIIASHMKKQNAMAVWFVLSYDEDIFTAAAEKKIKAIIKKEIPGTEGCTTDMIISFLQKFCWKDIFYGMKVIDAVKDEFDECMMLKTLLAASGNLRIAKFYNQPVSGETTILYCCNDIFIICGYYLEFEIAEFKDDVCDNRHRLRVKTQSYIPDDKQMDINLKIKIGARVFSGILYIKKLNTYSDRFIRISDKVIELAKKGDILETKITVKCVTMRSRMR